MLLRLVEVPWGKSGGISGQAGSTIHRMGIRIESALAYKSILLLNISAIALLSLKVRRKCDCNKIKMLWGRPIRLF